MRDVDKELNFKHDFTSSHVTTKVIKKLLPSNTIQKNVVG